MCPSIEIKFIWGRSYGHVHEVTHVIDEGIDTSKLIQGSETTLNLYRLPVASVL